MKVRGFKQVEQEVRRIARDKGISFMDAIDLYTTEREEHGIAVMWDQENDVNGIHLREQWVGKGAITFLHAVQELLSPTISNQEEVK